MTPNASTRLVQSDPVLEKIIAAIPPPRFESTQDVFFDLMSCVLEQQIHYRSSKKIFQKMLERAGLFTLTLENFEQFEQSVFPTAKLSAGKLETVERILAFFNSHVIDWHHLSDAEVIEQLSGIKGVGKWTMDMILLYTLQRPDVFPYDDFHLKEIMVKLYGLNPSSRLKAQMLELAGAWAGDRSLAVLYLLDWKAQLKKGI